MNVQRLCPVYKKWLQLNPLNARQHRLALQAQTQQAHQQGKRERARELGYQTFEAAKVILNALQSTSSNKEKAIQEDVLAFGTMGMYLSSLLAQEQKSVRPTPYCKSANSNLLQYYRFTPLALLFVD